MGYPELTVFCNQYLRPQNPFTELVNLTNLHSNSLTNFCVDVNRIEIEAEAESEYSEPMVLIGMYISVASIICILAMTLDLFNGFRNRNFWFPTKYFSLNAASITVITVAMKLPVDMTSPMPGRLDQIGKFGSLTFVFTIMSNLMPSLASMDNKSLVSNIVALSILVITLSVNAIIQIRTHVIGLYDLVGCRSWFSFFVSVLMIILPYIYIGMLLFLLIIFISSAITIPTSKRILEIKYQAIRKTILMDQNQQQNHLISSVDELRLLVKKYWIMAETGSPQFVMASNPLSSACSVICAISMLMYLFAVSFLVWFQGGPYLSLTKTTSVYKWSMIAIVVTQFIGVVVGSVAPIFRCFTFLSFEPFAKEKRNHFLVFKVDKYWTQTLFEWKESRIISVLSSGRRSKALLHRLKNRILRFFIGFQRGVVVVCKILRLLPFGVAFLFIHFSRIFNSVKKKMLSFNNTSTDASSSSIVDSHEDDLRKYVLLLEDNMQLAKKTMNGISDSMNRLIQKAEKKRNKNLLKLIEQSVEEYDASNGVVTFDNDDQNFQSQISNIEHVNSWSLPIISLTCITISLPNIEKDRVDNLFKSVGEGLLYTHLVEKILNKESVYVNIRRATLELWHEVEVNHKWLNNTLERNAYIEKTPRDIITSFAQIAQNILDEFINTSSTNGDHLMENVNLPPKVIVANSMYRIAKTIESNNNSNIVDEEELFTQLCGMIADILATCFTNIPRAISMRCHESTVIEKREARVAAAIDFLGRTTEIIERLENRQLPNMDHDKMAYIDEWRLHFKLPYKS